MHKTRQRCVLCAIAVGVAVAGCGKKAAAPASTPTHTETNLVGQARHGRSLTNKTRTVKSPAKIKYPPLASVMDGLAAYRETTDDSYKTWIIYTVGEFNTEDALGALVALFQAEPEPDLKANILDAMSDIDSPNSIAAVAIGLDAAQPTAVRVEAISTLMYKDDVAALPYLEPLTTNANHEVAAAALHAVEMLNMPSAARHSLPKTIHMVN